MTAATPALKSSRVDAADGGREGAKRPVAEGDAASIRGVHHRQTAPKPLMGADAATPAWAARMRRD